jgi:hypothetical protein
LYFEKADAMAKLKSYKDDSDMLIKRLLKQYKSIEIALDKFNSKKYNNGSFSNLKGNILRMSLLPFLRNHNLLSNHFSVESPIYKSLANVIVLILIKWWSSLLNNLTESTSNSVTLHVGYISSILTSDKNAYLEGISRIMSIEYWKTIDLDLYKQYQQLLTSTMEYCLDKMSTMKNLNLSVSAFFGKVFAYASFNLPHICHALLFLLGVKQDKLEKTNVLLNLIPEPSHKTRRSSLTKLTNQDNFDVDCTPINNPKNQVTQASYLEIFPEYLQWLINFKGISCTKRQRSAFNCLPPPKHPVEGIKDPNGNWVRRWCNCDSNVFNSFFRHYIRIIDAFDAQVSLANCPGFPIVLSHIIHIFQISILRISNNSKQQAPVSKKTNGQIAFPVVPSLKTSDVYYNSMIKIFKTVRDINHSSKIEPVMSSPPTPSTSCASVSRLSPSPILKDMPVSATGKKISTELVGYIDLSLRTIAKETNVFDANKSSLILSCTYEFINHIVNNIPNSSGLVNWEFWLSCCYMIIRTTDHLQSLLKSFAFLFNIWDMIPDALSTLSNDDVASPCYDWLTNRTESFKLNFVNWLIGSENFTRFFTYWNPAVRSYYLRLLVWRVIGVNNSQSSSAIDVTTRLQSNFNISHAVLRDFILKFHGLYDLDFKPDNPLVNRKFGILPLNTTDEYLSVTDDPDTAMMSATPIKSYEIRKTHPYEIFDEAVYTCSSLPSTTQATNEEQLDNESDNNKRNGHYPFANSLGKLFKLLSDDDGSSPRVKPGNKSQTNINKLSSSQPFKRSSVSLTSLSTASLRSLPGSPSIMSFRSNSNSITETSPSSSIRDPESEDSSILTFDVKNLDSVVNTQPNEFSKLPPEIVRPMYKFDIILDHESMSDKMNMIRNKNNCRGLGYTHQSLQHPEYYVSKSIKQAKSIPNCPQIPLITLFVTSDVYDSKFFLNDEETFVLDNIEIEKHKQILEGGLFEELVRSYSQAEDTIRGTDLSSLTNLGRSLNELNNIIEEFKTYLDNRISIDQFNLEVRDGGKEFNDFNYLHKIIPLLSFDSTNESKLLNAS